MTGTIKFTTGHGGVITPDNETATVPFSWVDCDDIGPSNVGHGTAVQFYIEVVSGRDRAIGVRRFESKLCHNQ